MGWLQHWQIRFVWYAPTRALILDLLSLYILFVMYHCRTTLLYLLHKCLVRCVCVW